MTYRPCRYHQQLSRRELLQVGGSAALGLGLTSVMNQTAGAQGTIPAKAKSVIVIHLTGACSHHDTFDMKPEAPAEVPNEIQEVPPSVE